SIPLRVNEQCGRNDRARIAWELAPQAHCFLMNYLFSDGRPDAFSQKKKSTVKGRNRSRSSKQEQEGPCWPSCSCLLLLPGAPGPVYSAATSATSTVSGLRLNSFTAWSGVRTGW